MNKIVRWARLAFAHVCASLAARKYQSIAVVALVVLAGPAASQQQTAATPGMSDEQLRSECLRWFGGKRYSGTVKNATYYYRFGRTVTIRFNTDGDLSKKDGMLVCAVRAHSESDDRQVWDEIYYFDGSTARFTNPKKPTTDWISFTPSGSCLARDGRFRSHFGFGEPDEPGHIYKVGGGPFCP